VREEAIIKLFNNWSGETALSIKPLPISGSNRKYYRINSSGKKAIGVFNEELKENIAFLAFSRHFRNKGLRVPEMYSYDLENNIYIQEDLGDTTLFIFITENNRKENYQSELSGLYKNIISELLNFQFKGREDLDFSLCYPRESFDRQSMHWDLTYFKYYFLKLAKVTFDEQKLENDYNTLIDYLLSVKTDYFL